MENKQCSCGWWEISGMPCKHDALCIGYKRERIEEYVHPYFTVETYMKAYDGAIHPVPSYVNLNDNPIHVIEPPPLKRLHGRPRKSRRTQEGEEQPSAAVTTYSTVRCGTCKILGHNRATCQRSSQDPREPQAANRGRGAKRGRGARGTTTNRGRGARRGRGANISKPSERRSISNSQPTTGWASTFMTFSGPNSSSQPTTSTLFGNRAPFRD